MFVLLLLFLPVLYSQVIILIGNKADLEAQRDVTYEEAKQFAEENGEPLTEQCWLEGERGKRGSRCRKLIRCELITVFSAGASSKTLSAPSTDSTKTIITVILTKCLNI